MSEPSSEPLPASLEAIEAEWEARRGVEGAHATFHIKPSKGAADALCRALDTWRAAAAAIPPTGQFTVHYDNGRKAVFEKFDSHDTAASRVLEIAAELGRFAIIVEDEK